MSNDRMSPDKRSPPPMPRNPQIAVQEEFDQAAARNTVATWDLFIARHPANALVPAAQARRQKLQSR